MGRRRSGRWVPPQPFSLDEAARGTDVRELDQPLPVYAWFQLPDRLIRRDDALASSMTRDAVWVEAGRGETKLAAWVCGAVCGTVAAHQRRILMANDADGAVRRADFAAPWWHEAGSLRVSRRAHAS